MNISSVLGRFEEIAKQMSAKPDELDHDPTATDICSTWAAASAALSRMCDDVKMDLKTGTQEEYSREYPMNTACQYEDDRLVPVHIKMKEKDIEQFSYTLQTFVFNSIFLKCSLDEANRISTEVVKEFIQIALRK